MSEKSKIAYIEKDTEKVKEFLKKSSEDFSVYVFENGFKFYEWINNGGVINAVISHGKINSPNGLSLLKLLRTNEKYESIPFIFILDKIDDQVRKELLKEQVAELFESDFDKESFKLRTMYLIGNSLKPKVKISSKGITIPAYRIPLAKRAFDIIVSLTALILLSPLFLLVALLIRLESRGPIFYSSRRAGTGYNIFNFYKFRSMFVGADQKLKDLSHLNQYKNGKGEQEADEKNKEKIGEVCEEGKVVGEVIQTPVKSEKTGELVMKMIDELDLSNPSNQIIEQYKNETVEQAAPAIDIKCDECTGQGMCCQSVLYLDGKAVCEKVHIEMKKRESEGTFIKISNDPRITKIGKILRNASIDELPQLFNVLKGDMSIVGNRPLPLYEAEKITTDQFALRFLAPSGITGLWQVTKRGKAGPMSEEERMELDNDYAKNYSFWRDIKIILQTVPALFQKDNV